ncbi:MAG TPA: hypothetical protein IAD10_05955 [Candidatus Fimicola cottocaccae]|nr:hypothetical protein [Candidatus Fimicola cottocaccae]
MKKNNLLAKTALAGGMLIIPAIINRGIFKISEIRGKDNDDEGFFFESNMGNIHYKIKGVGEPLLLIHSVNYIGASMKEWENNIDELSFSYKVYTIDLPGFGKSEKPRATFTAYNYALLLNSFIENVIKKPCNVIASGTSCGFALMADRIESGNIKKLMLVSPTGVEGSDIALKSDTKTLKLYEMPYIGSILYGIKSSKRSISRILESEVFFGKENITDDFKNNCFLNARRKGVDSRFAYASFISKFMNTDIKTSFEGIKIPIYVVWGEENKNNSVSNVDILEELRPDVMFAVFEHTSMLPYYENSEEFNSITEEFFK